MSTVRPQRADAVRNRRRILDAAAQQITSRGSEVGMDDIARAAGVAVGTLYRHFPTKTDLVAAVIGEYVAEVADDAEASLARTRGGAAAVEEVVGFLDRVAYSTARTQAVKTAARGLGVTGHDDQTDETRAVKAVAALLAVAQDTGDIRPGITTDDIYLLMSTIPSDQPAEVRSRWFELMLPGILTADVQPPPHT